MGGWGWVGEEVDLIAGVEEAGGELRAPQPVGLAGDLDIDDAATPGGPQAIERAAAPGDRPDVAQLPPAHPAALLDEHQVPDPIQLDEHAPQLTRLDAGEPGQLPAAPGVEQVARRVGSVGLGRDRLQHPPHRGGLASLAERLVDPPGQLLEEGLSLVSGLAHPWAPGAGAVGRWRWGGLPSGWGGQAR